MPSIVYKKKSWRTNKMADKYSPAVEFDDPEITLRIPTKILRDLVLRAEENGYSVENELAKRLARTLEHDFEMIAADNAKAYEAFDLIKNDPEFAKRALPVK